MNNQTMTKLARRLIPEYDLYRQTGIPKSVAIPNQNAAKQIMDDIVKQGLFFEFVLLLMEFSVQGNGIAGRKISIPYMRQILNEVYKMGFIFDHENNIFVENPAERKTRNWGTLRPNTEYTISLLRMDIADNSKLVRNNPQEKVESAYLKIRDFFISSVEKRNGRVWAWDGDGGLAAFCFGNMNESAALSAIEILHEIFLFNYKDCPLKEKIQVRLSAHSGPLNYTSNNEKLADSETVKETINIEHKHTKAGRITISNSVKVMLEPLTAKQFTGFKSKNKRTYYEYMIKQDCNA